MNIRRDKGRSLDYDPKERKSWFSRVQSGEAGGGIDSNGAGSHQGYQRYMGRYSLVGSKGCHAKLLIWQKNTMNPVIPGLTRNPAPSQ
jgi:hypothetical protein